MVDKEKKRPYVSNDGSDRRRTKISKTSSQYFGAERNSSNSIMSTISTGGFSSRIRTVMDSGSDAEACISTSLANTLSLTRIGVDEIEMVDGTRVEAWVGHIPLLIIADRIALRNIHCHVIDGVEPDCVILGQPILVSLGIDPERHLNMIEQGAYIDLGKLEAFDEIEEDDDSPLVLILLNGH